jgi:hypothetical protein
LSSDHLPGTWAVFLLFQVECDLWKNFLTTSVESSCIRRGSSSAYLLCQIGFQVFQLLTVANAEFVQKGLLSSSRWVLCAEEVVDLLGHLMEDRDCLNLLKLLAIKLLLRES